MSQMPGGSSHLSLTMATLCISGGAYAYIKKASKPSLAGGVGAGILYLGAVGLIKNDQDFNGHTLACTTGALLAGGMGSRVMKGAKFMPAGLVATLGMVSMLYEGKKALEWR